MPTPPPLEECLFYHVMDLPGIRTIEQNGLWDLRGRFDDYIGHVDVSGKTVLDVGTASGFLTFEAEKRGAKVTSFDADSSERYQYLPVPDRDREFFDESLTAQAPSHYMRLRNSYRLAHALLDSQARAIYGDIYRLSELVPACDVVLVGQLLVHLRDPLEALRQASLLAKETLIITEGSFESDQPLAIFLGPGHYYAWWH